MAKTNKELRLDMSLKEWLARYTKEELVDNAALIGMGGVSVDDKKDRVLERWESYVRNCMDDIINITSTFELELMRKLLQPENKFGIASRNIDEVLPITQTGLIISAPHPLGKGFAVYMMLDEVKEIARLYVELEWQNRVQHGYHRLEQLALGTLNLFGGMKAQDWFEYIERYIDAKDKKQWKDYQNYLMNNTLFAAHRIFHVNPQGRTDCFFASPYIENDEDLHRLFNDVVWDKPVHHYKEYPKQMVLDYGKLPFPHITVPSMDTVRSMMLNTNERPYTEEEADYTLYRLWITRQLEQTTENVDIMLDIPLRVSAGEEKDDDGVTEALANSFRDLPMWHMDGQTMNGLTASIDERLEKVEPQAKVVAPAATRATHIPMIADPAHKIGRNEPCWCGSGKKYKHCHGK